MATQQPPYYTLTHFPWSGPGPAPDGYRTWNTVPQQQQTQQGTQQQPNPYLQGSNSMAMATPGPNGQYGAPQWGTPPPGAMAGMGPGGYGRGYSQMQLAQPDQAGGWFGGPSGVGSGGMATADITSPAGGQMGPSGGTVGGYTDPNYSMGPTGGAVGGQGERPAGNGMGPALNMPTGMTVSGNMYNGIGGSLTGGSGGNLYPSPDTQYPGESLNARDARIRASVTPEQYWSRGGGGGNAPVQGSFDGMSAAMGGADSTPANGYYGGGGGVPDTMQKYGYGNRPGQGGGYYEQQTPAGSFAAANQQNAGVTFAQNPYIGRASAQYGQTNNPYLGGSSGQATAATNPYAGAGNPYTSQYIDQASADAARNYNLYIAPQRDAQMARSGSFGNTGVQQMQLEDQRNLQNTLGGIATTARMNDLAAQQRMGESAADRQTGVSQFNTGMRGTDLNRNLLGTFQGQGMGLQALGLDANLAQQLGLGNAGFANTNSMFNAGQGNAINMFNVGQGNNMLERFRDRSMMSDQFNQTMDRNIWNDNMGWMRTGNQDMWNNLDKLMNWNGQGINAANQQQNTPMDQWLRMITGAGGLSGQGGTTTGTNNQTMQGNPFMGALGALLFGNKLFGG